MALRTILFILSLLLSNAILPLATQPLMTAGTLIGNPVGSVNSDSLSVGSASSMIGTTTSTSLAPPSQSSCIVKGGSCADSKHGCCSKFCRCEPKNPFMCTCADLRPSVGLASPEPTPAFPSVECIRYPGCIREGGRCKYSGDCCSDNCSPGDRCIRATSSVEGNCLNSTSTTTNVGTATALYPTTQASADNGKQPYPLTGYAARGTDDAEECQPERTRCKHDEDCCNEKCRGWGIGDKRCWSPTTDNPEISTDSPGLQNLVTRQNVGPICARNGQSCGGYPSDCCSGFCWCNLWNPFACTCAPRDIVDTNGIDLNVRTDVSVAESDQGTRADYALEGETVNTKSLPDSPFEPIPPCKGHETPCKIHSDCCSQRCVSRECKRRSPHDRGLPEFLPCKLKGAQRVDNEDCCSRRCKSGKCKKQSSQDSIADFSLRDPEEQIAQ